MEAQQIARLGSWEWNVETGRVTWTDELYHIYGLEPGSFTGTYDAYIALVHPGDREKAAAVIQKAFETGAPFFFEERIVRPNGEVRWLQSRGEVIRDGTGKPVRMVGVCQDRTDQRAVETALRASEERFSKAFRASPAPMTISTLAEGRYLDANESFLKLTGYGLEEIVGRTSVDLTFWATPEERARALNAFREDGQVRDVEVTIRRKTGEERRVLFSLDRVELEGKPCLLSFSHDITDRVAAEEELRRRQERFELVVLATKDVIWEWDLATNREWWSEGITTVFGYPASAVGPLASWWDERVHPDDKVRVIPVVYEFVKGEGRYWVSSYRFRRADGSYAHVQDRGYVIRDKSGRAVKMVGAITDVTEQHLAEERIQHQAYHDSLTGLPNRLLFGDRLNQALAHAHRHKGRVSVIFLDIDHFKRVNDALGHSVGDELLRRVAGRLAKCMRDEDTIARVGGDEFALLFEIADAGEATRAAERILGALSTPIILDDHQLDVTASLGIALYPADGTDEATLLRNADAAMYRAKDLGRNNFQLCTPDLNARALDRMTLEGELRRAMERQEFILHYQPLIDLATGRLTGLEALLRWQHPHKGLVQPGTFIPVAEEGHLIVAIGEWVLREACRQLRVWKDAGHPSFRVSVNLSARQFQQRGLAETVRRALEEQGLPAAQLELEITESMAMQNAEWTADVLRTLRKMGVRIAVDDFGTGQSSLSYLRQFPFNTVKIDRAFVRDLTVDPVDEAIVKAVIGLAHSLGLTVVAEGVETHDQLAFLRHAQCEEVQGHLFSKALPAERLGEILERGTSAFFQ
jgi:diguanylate cyclase (GGDEF)-like protein/PAS domain S-box-containing protein